MERAHDAVVLHLHGAAVERDVAGEVDRVAGAAGDGDHVGGGIAGEGLGNRADTGQAEVDVPPALPGGEEEAVDVEVADDAAGRAAEAELERRAAADVHVAEEDVVVGEREPAEPSCEMPPPPEMTLEMVIGSEWSIARMPLSRSTVVTLPPMEPVVPPLPSCSVPWETRTVPVKASLSAVRVRVPSSSLMNVPLPARALVSVLVWSLIRRRVLPPVMVVRPE